MTDCKSEHRRHKKHKKHRKEVLQLDFSEDVQSTEMDKVITPEDRENERHGKKTSCPVTTTKDYKINEVKKVKKKKHMVKENSLSPQENNHKNQSHRVLKRRHEHGNDKKRKKKRKVDIIHSDFSLCESDKPDNSGIELLNVTASREDTIGTPSEVCQEGDKLTKKKHRKKKSKHGRYPTKENILNQHRLNIPQKYVPTCEEYGEGGNNYHPCANKTEYPEKERRGFVNKDTETRKKGDLKRKHRIVNEMNCKKKRSHEQCEHLTCVSTTDTGVSPTGQEVSVNQCPLKPDKNFRNDNILPQKRKDETKQKNKKQGLYNICPRNSGDSSYPSDSCPTRGNFAFTLKCDEKEPNTILSPLTLTCEEREPYNNFTVNSIPPSILTPSGMNEYACDKKPDREEELLFSILHKSVSTNGDYYKRVLQELMDNNVIHLLMRGRWKSSEFAQLQENMNTFKVEYPDWDPTFFLYPYKHPKIVRKIHDYYSVRRRFILGLGYRIRRTLNTVLYIATFYFFGGKRGKLDCSERKIIRDYKKSGARNDFKHLSALLNRHSSHIRSSFIAMGDSDTVFGPWTVKEDNQLLFAVKNQTKIYDMRCISGLSWVEIAKSVPTRTSKQCHHRYVHTLRWREENNAVYKPPMSVVDRIRLLEMICESNAQEEAEIDWHSMISHFPEASSHSSLQEMWYKLKLKVPNYSQKSLDEITDYLAKYELSRLENKLKRTLEVVENENNDNESVADQLYIEIKKENPEAD